MKTTITEALQEVKTISSRIEKKQNAVGQYVGRDSRILDPLQKGGGSIKFISEERQSIADLRTRWINIRSAIQTANLTNQITVAGKTRSVSDWLTWRREVSNGEKYFVDALLAGIRKLREGVQKQGGRTSSLAVESNSDVINIIVNVDEQSLIKEQESIETCLSELDGKLSLFNAVTTIEV